MSDELTDAERSFYDLCYDQYKGELEQADCIYQRAGVLLTALPVIGAVSYGLGRLDLLDRLFTRIDVFVYYLACLGLWLLVAASIYSLLRSILVRKYSSLATMRKWHEWLEEYRKRFPNEGKDMTDEDKKTMGAELIRSLTPMFADAQTRCAEHNETRRRWFGWAMRFTAWAMVGLGVQALCYLIFSLQGGLHG